MHKKPTEQEMVVTVVLLLALLMVLTGTFCGIRAMESIVNAQRNEAAREILKEERW